jgi:hypothetical protein
MGIILTFILNQYNGKYEIALSVSGKGPATGCYEISSPIKLGQYFEQI